MASSAVHSCINVSNTNNLGLATFGGGDINHKPWSHSKRQLLNMPKRSTCYGSIRHQIVVSSLSATSVSTATTCASTTTSSMEATTSTTMTFSSNYCLPLLWREIQGCDNWEDLLDPLHPLLRDEIIRYGEFVMACYEAFDLNPGLRWYLNCKFGKKSLFQEVGLGGLGYKVTKYIYATPDVNILIQNGDSCTGQWIGYVAVSTDEAVRRLGRRDVVITFRGTVTNPEWIANLSCREQLLSEVSRLLSKYKGESMSITLAGHSMGSSLALLLAYDISELGLNRSNPVNPTILDDHRVPITVFSFGGPRVGNFTFKERCEELGIKVLRIVNINDPITKLPGVLFNENFRVLGGRYEFPWSCSCYAHVGIELAVEFFSVQNPSCVHDLETYISLLKSPKTTEIQRAENIMPTVDLLQKVRDFLSVPKTSTTCSHGGTQQSK
ncbi:hypothetical protein CDL15_Pgr013146 [Punica granatum]|uniref:Fungal lipase-type domain-containing protein n=1 Tax=Punica granatum TaxID=22663 RepID=A0A218WDR5_PUNGR|nr:hypothetical protein CDL15_Pgr013146 [Punica granatum]